jgi:hypothetical protein
MMVFNLEFVNTCLYRCFVRISYVMKQSMRRGHKRIKRN